MTGPPDGRRRGRRWLPAAHIRVTNDPDGAELTAVYRPGQVRSVDLALVAERVRDDPYAPIRDRTHAARVLHRLRHVGGSVATEDAALLRLVYASRRRMLAELARRYGT